MELTGSREQGKAIPVIIHQEICSSGVVSRAEFVRVEAMKFTRGVVAGIINWQGVELRSGVVKVKR